jgi:hypothetical protein
MTTSPVSERCPSRTMLRRASAMSSLSSFLKQAQQSNRAVSTNPPPPPPLPGGRKSPIPFLETRLYTERLYITDSVGAVESVKAASDIVRTGQTDPRRNGLFFELN